jgi:hypothetical protein
LIVGNLVTRLIHAREAEVAILAHFTVLHTIDYHGLVASTSEFPAVSVIYGETYSFTAKPITCLTSVFLQLVYFLQTHRYNPHPHKPD